MEQATLRVRNLGKQTRKDHVYTILPRYVCVVEHGPPPLSDTRFITQRPMAALAEYEEYHYRLSKQKEGADAAQKEEEMRR